MKAEGEKKKLSLKEFVSPLKVKSFRKLVYLYICQAITLDIASAVIIYYRKYVVDISSTVFLGIFLGVQLIMFAPIYHLIKRSKTKIYRFGLPLTILAAIGIAFYPQGAPVLPLYIYWINGIGICGAQSTPWLMFPDVVDIVTLAREGRKTGTCSGIMTLFIGIICFAIFLIGLALQFTGYINPTDANPNPTQPASAIFGIRFICFWIFHIDACGFLYFKAPSLKSSFK